jgi:L-gulono-1,4-lactone dehydrogenase
MAAPHVEAVENFGGNVAFRPRAVHQPRSESEVLVILAEERGKRIRAVGRLHSWSRVTVADEVLLDLRYLNGVEVSADRTYAVIGAGCQIKRVLSELDQQGLTLPSVGLISEQAIAGAAATGTHGSGKNSLSHYVNAVRIAGYDAESGEPVIREIRKGDELRAARCSLGCLGIVLALEVPVRPQYRVEEWLRFYDTLDEVLAAEAEAPLQQFFLLPWRGDWLAQHRRETERPRSWFAPFYRAYWFTVVDVMLHVVLRLLVQTLRSPRAVKAFYRWVVPWTIIRRGRVVDDSPAALIMEHELFRHIEIEVFVTRSRLPAALEFVNQILLVFDGGGLDAVSQEVQQALAAKELLAALSSARGAYTHHYPICVRRVLPDDTLISMASGGEAPHYAISFISYARPVERDGFFLFAEFVARSTSLLFDARCHWGKVCPHTAEEIERLYPHAARFREICGRYDPSGVFRNGWIDELLFSGANRSAGPAQPAALSHGPADGT